MAAKPKKKLFDLSQENPGFELRRALAALTWAAETKKKRQKPVDVYYSDTLLLTETLVDIFGADAETLYAAIFYSAVAPDRGTKINPSHFDEIAKLFTDKEGKIDESFRAVKDIIINALQIEACSLIALPHPIKDIEAAFHKPTQDEAEDIRSYFALTNNMVKDARAFALRATEWYLRLVDMRENPQKYTQEDRLNAYYYTDKFYSPYCEFLALQQLKVNPNYSAADEDKGFYCLHAAMDEELIRQINPAAYKAITAQLNNMLMEFNRVEKDRANKISEFRRLVTDLGSKTYQDIQVKLLNILDELNPEKKLRLERDAAIKETIIHNVEQILSVANELAKAELKSAISVLRERPEIAATTIKKLKKTLNKISPKTVQASTPGQSEADKIDASLSELKETLNAFEVARPSERMKTKKIQGLESLVNSITYHNWKNVQNDLLKIVQAFKVENEKRPDLRDMKLFERVRAVVEYEMRHMITKAGIPLGATRIEMRPKSARSVYQKMLAQRVDIFDWLAARPIINIDWLNAGLFGQPSGRGTRLTPERIAGKLQAEIAQNYETVPGRFRNYYAQPRDPDNGYRAIHLTVIIGGQPVEVQIVDLPSHINNSLGEPSHVAHKLVGIKKGEANTGISTGQMMSVFFEVGTSLVIRTQEKFIVMPNDSTGADLATRIFGSAAGEVTLVATSHDPMEPLVAQQISPETKLGNGWEIWASAGGEFSNKVPMPRTPLISSSTDHAQPDSPTTGSVVARPDRSAQATP